MQKSGKLAVTALLILILVGCSSGGNPPVTPELQDSQIQASIETSSTLLWGLWDVTIDPVTRTAEIVPIRGVQFTANVTLFMQPPQAATNLLTLLIDPASDFPNGYVVCDVSFKHPFPGLDQFTGFDVRGVCIGNGTQAGIFDPNIQYGASDELRVLNADGLTRWFNPTEFTTYDTIFGFTPGKAGMPGTDFTATLNGYKYFCDGLGSDDDVVEFFGNPVPSNPRGYFSAGNTLTRQYEIQFPKVGGAPEFYFQYAVVAGWEPPATVPPVVPDDFPISANCHEAFCLSTLDQSDMYYSDPTNKGGNLNLLVRVFDHQGADNPSGVSAEIGGIHLETSGGLIPGDLASFDPAALDLLLVGQDEISATYLLQVPNTVPSGQGEFPVMVIIENDAPGNYDQGFAGFDFPDGTLAAYFTAYVNVGVEVQNDPPMAVAEIVTDPPYCPGVPIEFDASGSYDPDGGSIVLYEWDFDGDGVYGDSYDSGTDVNPTKIFTDFGDVEVDLRVTDDESDTDTLDELLSLEIDGATWVDDDNTSGPWDGSFENPYQTIQDGIDNANMDCGAGWVLVVTGTYQENITIPGSVTVVGWGDPAPLITTVDSDTNIMVNFGSSSNSTFKRFQAQPRTSATAISSGGSSNTIEDIEFLDNAGGATCSRAVSTSGSGHTIDGVTVDGYQKPAAGFIYMNGQNSTMINNVVLNLTFTGACNMNVLSLYQGGTNSLMAKNVVGHITFSEAFVSTQWITVVAVDYCAGSTVRNNLLFDLVNNLDETGWTWGIDAENASNMTFEHNTISGISGPAWIFAFETNHNGQDSSGVTHRDHIITSLTAGMMNWRWAFLGSWSNNLPVDYSCTYSVGNSFRDQLVQGTGCLININPQFVNSGNDDYRVQDGSPCDGTAHDGTDMGAYGGSDPLTWLPD